MYVWIDGWISTSHSDPNLYTPTHLQSTTQTYVQTPVPVHKRPLNTYIHAYITLQAHRPNPGPTQPTHLINPDQRSPIIHTVQYRDSYQPRPRPRSIPTPSLPRPMHSIYPTPRPMYCIAGPLFPEKKSEPARIKSDKIKGRWVDHGDSMYMRYYDTVQV